MAGARIRCYNFSRNLIARGIDAQVVSFKDGFGAFDGAEESKMTLNDKIRANLKVLNYIRQQKDIILLIQRFNYHSFAPFLMHIFAKTKTIFDLDDWEMDENPRYHFGFYPSSKAHFFSKVIAKRSNFCIGASRFLQDFLSLSNKKSYYLPSGVDTEKFYPVYDNLNNREFVFAWIGTLNRMEYIENLESLFRCFQQVRRVYPFVYLDIIGSGIYEVELKEIVRLIGDSHIRLKGWIDPDKVNSYLASVNVAVMPMVRSNNFNFSKSPVKLFEYMSTGKPVVASSIGEASKIIQDGSNGFLAKTEKEFTEKMLILVNDPELCIKLGKEAVRTIEQNYSLNILGDKLYNMILENIQCS